MSRALIITGIVVTIIILVAMLGDGGTQREAFLALTAALLGYLLGLATKHEMWVWVKKHGKTTK